MYFASLMEAELAYEEPYIQNQDLIKHDAKLLQWQHPSTNAVEKDSRSPTNAQAHVWWVWGKSSLNPRF